MRQDASFPPSAAVRAPAGSTDDERRTTWFQGVALVAICLALYLAGNGRTGLWDRDEPRNAVAVHEMRARGD